MLPKWVSSTCANNTESAPIGALGSNSKPIVWVTAMTSVMSLHNAVVMLLYNAEL